MSPFPVNHCQLADHSSPFGLVSLFVDSLNFCIDENELNIKNGGPFNPPFGPNSNIFQPANAFMISPVASRLLLCSLVFTVSEMLIADGKCFVKICFQILMAAAVVFFM